MKQLIKPFMLRAGDTVATITTSWAGANAVPYRYEIGKKALESFGVKVIETPNALKTQEELHEHPELRASDLMWAFENPTVKAIIGIIGGNDSIRMLPFVNFNTIRDNPKIFMGFSDPTAVHMMCHHAGLSSIYGPTILTGFAENCGMNPYIVNSVKKTLFDNSIIGDIKPSEQWTEQMLDWFVPENQNIPRQMTFNMGPVCVQGKSNAKGRLLGGCFDILSQIDDTEIFPTDWTDTILFIECSESAPSEEAFKNWLEKMADRGVLQQWQGIIMGRPKNADGNLGKYENPLRQVLEKYNPDIPVLSRMDFGHTDPIFCIPYGALAEINPVQKKLTILESAVR